MLKYILTVSIVLFNVASVFGSGDQVNILSKDTFDCKTLTENDRLPENWKWMDVREQLKEEGCLERILSAGYLSTGDSLRQLLDVAETYTGEDLQKICAQAEGTGLWNYAKPGHLRVLKECGVDVHYYPLVVIADIFEKAGYTFEGTNIDPTIVDWEMIRLDSDTAPKLKQRLWLALIAIIDRCDTYRGYTGTHEGLDAFLVYIRKGHGIVLDPSAPLTEPEIQIISLLPAALEYIGNNGGFLNLYKIKMLYVPLKEKVASNPTLSLHLRSRFFLNPATNPALKSELARGEFELPPINDTQMTEEIFAYGDNLDRITDPVDRRLARAAREKIHQLLFHPKMSPAVALEQEQD